ncbi:MAG: hypothetical protein IPG45_39225 [Deltaproteobacteria bacterium]|nr:hypothetical protein [Deltaproteobacteria bacterium]
MKIHTLTTDCRCKACGALLAKLDRDGLTIRRGDMQVVVSGDSTVAVTCYRDRCRTLNVLPSRKPTPPAPANALPNVSAA